MTYLYNYPYVMTIIIIIISIIILNLIDIEILNKIIIFFISLSITEYYFKLYDYRFLIIVNIITMFLIYMRLG